MKSVRSYPQILVSAYKATISPQVFDQTKMLRKITFSNNNDYFRVTILRNLQEIRGRGEKLKREVNILYNNPHNGGRNATSPFDRIEAPIMKICIEWPFL